MLVCKSNDTRSLLYTVSPFSAHYLSLYVCILMWKEMAQLSLCLALKCSLQKQQDLWEEILQEGHRFTNEMLDFAQLHWALGNRSKLSKTNVLKDLKLSRSGAYIFHLQICILWLFLTTLFSRKILSAFILDRGVPIKNTVVCGDTWINTETKNIDT